MSQKILEVALSQVGIREIAGPTHNPEIVNYFDEIGHQWVDDDETAWCSAFMNWCALKAGVERSNKLNARSWLDVGKEVKEPQLGDVVIFWRGSPDSWKGHVALFIAKRNGFIYVLGGNQSNEVRISAYNQTRLLGYRRLAALKPALEDELRNAIAQRYERCEKTDPEASQKTLAMVVTDIKLPTGLSLDTVALAMEELGFESNNLKGEESLVRGWIVKDKLKSSEA